MNPETKYVPFERFQDLILQSGLPFEELAGFVKVTAQKGRKVYVPRTQKVGRVDISGFEYPGKGVVNLGDEAFGGVRQQLDFSADEEATLENFVAVLAHMASLPPVETRSRTPRASEGTESGRRRLGRPSMTDQIEDEAVAESHAKAASAAGQQAHTTRGRNQKQTGQHQPRRR